MQVTQDVSSAIARAGARAAHLSESEAATFCLQQMFCGSGCFFPSQDGLLAEQLSGRRLKRYVTSTTRVTPGSCKEGEWST